MSHDVYTDDDLLKDMSFILATYNVSVRCWKDILIYVRNILKKESSNPTFSDEDRMILAAVLSFLIRKDNESRWVIYAYYAFSPDLSLISFKHGGNQAFSAAPKKNDSFITFHVCISIATKQPPA